MSQTEIEFQAQQTVFSAFPVAHTKGNTSHKMVIIKTLYWISDFKKFKSDTRPLATALLVHVKIKIVNKEAATKQSMLLHAQLMLRMVAVPLNKAM